MEPDDKPRPSPRSAADESALVQRLTNEALAGTGGTDVTPVDRLDDADLRRKDLQQDIDLKKTYARATLIGVGVQLLIADIAFFWYLVDVRGHIPASVMDVWLSATVVQVIGVILVITNYLFPHRGRDE